MLLNRNNLEIAKFCSKDITRPLLQKLRILPGRTEASNGVVLVRVTIPQAEDDDFPKINGFTVTKKSKRKEVLVEGKDIARITKDIPKVNTLPILAHAQVDFHGSNGSLRVATTNLDTSTIREYRTPDDTPYPNTDKIMPGHKDCVSGTPAFNKDEPVFTIGFDAQLLASVLTEAAKYQPITHGVKIEFYGYKCGARITAHSSDTGQDFEALVMPSRLAE